MLGLGLVVRAILIPITHGQDFVVWDLASRGTLEGHNIFAHHPHFPGGPFAYFPLFLYLEVPFRWLALHGAGSFQVWGKVPIVVGDLACAALVAAELRRRGCTDRAVAVGAALVFLNPVVLYNSAYYGRFDSIGCALLAGAAYAVVRTGPGGRSWPVWFGLAVAAKTFPAFTAVGFLRRARGARSRMLACAVAIPLVLSIPYLFTPRAFLHDVVAHDLIKSPQGLSWQYLVQDALGASGAKKVSYVLLAAFVVVAVLLAGIEDLWLYCGAVLTAFLVTSKLVLEQYLTWPMVFLAVVGVAGYATRPVPARATLGLLALFSVIGVVDNETWHPFGRECFLGVVVALTAVAYVVVVLRERSAGEVRFGT